MTPVRRDLPVNYRLGVPVQAPEPPPATAQYPLAKKKPKTR